MTPTIKLALGSLAVGAVVLGLKSLAYLATGSVALLSDALESTVNVATALAALVAVRVAAQPADANHPYGHHKAEYLSAVLEGVMIVIAALLILRSSAQALALPREIEAPFLGLAINGVATVLNGVWAWILITRGRRLKSPALEADGQHLATDVGSSFGVGLGLVLAVATGWWWLDPVLAALVAVNILWSGSKVVRASLGGLMDEAVPDRVLEQIHAVIAAEAGGAVEAHDIRTRQAGQMTFIDFHLVVPGEITVYAAHEICDRVERGLHAALGEARISIHVEPEHKSKQEGLVLDG